MEELVKVHVHELIVDPRSNQPVVFLAGPRKERALLIWIGISEATAIYSEMQGLGHRRPLTHDLAQRIIERVRGDIHRIVITHQDGGVYYATLVLEQGRDLLEIDARPSDSIVMALKFGAPIYVSKTLFDEMAVPLKDEKEPHGASEVYGLTLQELTPLLRESFSFPSDQGVLVTDVRTGSPAEKDGVKRGDIFVEIGKVGVADVLAFRQALAMSRQRVSAKLFRDGIVHHIVLHPE
jgi:hypothetical protein